MCDGSGVCCGGGGVELAWVSEVDLVMELVVYVVII